MSDTQQDDLRVPLDEMAQEIKRRLQDAGFMVRMTEWHDGFQACAFKRGDVRTGHVSKWLPNEFQAYEEVLGALLPATPMGGKVP